MSLTLCPLTLRAANSYIQTYHRHHGCVQGMKFAIGLRDTNDVLVGVAVAGRPVSRLLDDGYTLEVTRLCTDGSPNACSMLYSACWRAAKAMGYRRAVTYILASESGVSLRASGWTRVEISSPGGSWSRPSRTRSDPSPTVPKHRYEVHA